MKSGLARILRPLEDALDRGARVRVLTTDYLAITDPDALTQLADLATDPDRLLAVRLFSGVRAGGWLLGSVLRFCSVSAVPAAGGPVVIDPDAGTAPLTVGASVGLEAAALRGGL